MSAFRLATVLGNGSKRVSAHPRFPLACYQSGSTLVLYDYIKDRKQHVALLPNQFCEFLQFSRDGLTVLGVWLGQAGQPTLSVWRVSDGERLAEQVLSDSCGGGGRVVGGVAGGGGVDVVHVVYRSGVRGRYFLWC